MKYGYLVSTDGYLESVVAYTICTTYEAIKEVARKAILQNEYGCVIKYISVLTDSLEVKIKTEDYLTTYRLIKFEIK